MTSKYKNVRAEYNGRIYASRKEAGRAQELDLLMLAKEVVDWTPQPPFDIIINGKKICTYVGDFAVLWADGTQTIEDVKGMRTAVYRLKKKLVEALYGITITEK